MQPLNPQLYRRLGQLFGAVSITNAGEHRIGQYYRDFEGRQRFQVITAGEQYRVSCPFCRFVCGSSDSRQRLYVSYLWGAVDEAGERSWWAAFCHNEKCISIPAYLNDLRDRVYSGLPVQRIDLPAVQQPVQIALPPCTLPEYCLPLTSLEASHEAIRFLRERDFDPTFLYEKYGVVYCVCAEPRYAQATCRIVIPVYSGGQLVTWQARYLGETDWREVPKYYNCPDRPKRHCLYGLDQAIGKTTAAIVESPLDVWRMGDGAVGLMGKTMSVHQTGLIRQHFTMAVVMLDQDAQRSALTVRDQLAHCGHAAIATLAANSPAQLTEEECWELVAGAIESYATQQGFLVS